MRNVYLVNESIVAVEQNNEFYVADCENDFALGEKIPVDRENDILDWGFDLDNPIQRRIFDWLAENGGGMYRVLNQNAVARQEQLAEIQGKSKEDQILFVRNSLQLNPVTVGFLSSTIAAGLGITDDVEARSAIKEYLLTAAVRATETTVKLIERAAYAAQLM